MTIQWRTFPFYTTALTFARARRGLGCTTVIFFSLEIHGRRRQLPNARTCQRFSDNSSTPSVTRRMSDARKKRLQVPRSLQTFRSTTVRVRVTNGRKQLTVFQSSGSPYMCPIHVSVTWRVPIPPGCLLLQIIGYCDWIQLISYQLCSFSLSQILEFFL